MTTTLQVNEALKAALEDLTSARKLWEQEIENKRRWFASCEQSLSQMIGSSDGQNGHRNGDIFAKHVAARRIEPKRVLSVGDDKVAMVRHYLQKHGEVRQAQIAKDLEVNSGTVSVALQVLHIGGEVSPGEKVEGSRVWKPVPKPVALPVAPPVAVA